MQELHDESETAYRRDMWNPTMSSIKDSMSTSAVKITLTFRKLLEWQPSRDALEQIGFGRLYDLWRDHYSDEGIWRSPRFIGTKIGCVGTIRSAVPRGPQNDFSELLSHRYKTGKNGCLKVIPGTHRRRIDLHDILVPAHEQGARFIDEDHPVMFSDHPDQVDVCAKAGSLVIADAAYLTLRPQKTLQIFDAP